MTQTKLNKLDFWNAFKDYGNQSDTTLKISRKPRPQHWYSISFGSSKAGLACTTNSRDNYVGVEIYINDDKNIYHRLYQNKDSFENMILNEDISWEELPEKKASRLRLVKKGNPENKDRWEEYFKWLIKNGERLVAAYNKYSK